MVYYVMHVNPYSVHLKTELQINIYFAIHIFLPSNPVGLLSLEPSSPCPGPLRAVPRYVAPTVGGLSVCWYVMSIWWCDLSVPFSSSPRTHCLPVLGYRDKLFTHSNQKPATKGIIQNQGIVKMSTLFRSLPPLTPPLFINIFVLFPGHWSYSDSSFKSCSVLQHRFRGAAEFDGTLFKCQPLVPLMLVWPSDALRSIW
jgi:hypothetical protein